MDVENDKDLAELAAEFSEEAKELGKTAGKVALSAALATTLSAALAEPPNTDLMSLPDATPIVLVLEEEAEPEPPHEEAEVDEDDLRRQRFRKMLKYLIIGLFLLAALLFGALKGCSACTATALLPHDDPEQEQQAEEQQDDADGASATAPFIGISVFS